MWKGNMELPKPEREKLKLVVEREWTAALARGVDRGLDDCGLEVHFVFDELERSKYAVGVGANLRCVGGKKDKSLSTTAVLDQLQSADWSLEFTRRARESMRALEARLNVRRSPPDEWVEILETGGDAAKSQAISECVKSNYRPCLEGLFPLFQKPPPLGVEAIGAVGLLGDENHLSRLAKLTASKDPETLLSALYAIQDIGGAKAQRYMQGIAEGHADPRMSKVAEQLLQEMKESN